ncbi:MAG: NAD(P)-dependent alcohol dehydrogenase [Deltaproteobacteria bacterium]|nr:NAD(P)-dependent alcohol dehydrogenase [Deltaproteobacteria bacterium]
MRAVTNRRYGGPEVLALEELPMPEPAPDQVLLEVRATSVNGSDVEFLTAKPAYIRGFGPFGPKFTVLGSDVAGVVVGVGSEVTRWKVGDEVFGDILYTFGGFAEYAVAPAAELMRKPPELSFVEAAAIPQSAAIGVQGVRDQGVGEGTRILINGAGGGAGTFAIQAARHLGAEVTAVDSGEKLALMRELGASTVIDYAAEDFTARGERYDRILDLTAAHSQLAYRRALVPDGRYLMVGGHVRHLLAVQTMGKLLSLGGRSFRLLVIEPNRDLDWMVERIVAGDIRPVLDTCYPLEQTADALRQVMEGRAKGKVVVTVGDAD